MERIHTIAILPAGGAFGTAIGVILACNGHEVTFGFRDPRNTQSFLETRQIKRLPGIQLPERLKATSNLVELVESSDLIVWATKMQYLRNFSSRLLPFVWTNALCLSLPKGIEDGTGMLPHQVISDLDTKLAARTAILSGPNFADEIARGLPAATVVASENEETAERIALAFSSSSLRAYPSTDPIGVGVGGALKNVIAIAAGVSDGLKEGESARAGIVTRGKIEMVRLGVALGGKASTLEGLSGDGDLWLSCTSKKSRNHQLGKALAEGVGLEELLASEVTYEGYGTAKVAAKLAKEKGIDAPIIGLVHQVLYEGLNIKEAKRLLLARQFVYEDSQPLTVAA